MNFRHFFQLSVLAFSLVLVQSCYDSPQAGAESSTKVTFIETKSKSSIIDILSPLLVEAGVPYFLASSIAKYDVTVSKMVYITKNPAGKDVKASGLIIIPKTTSETSHDAVCFMHGTIINQSQGITTAYPNDNGASSSYGAITASMGKIVIIPDYIGYGESKNEKHPYQHISLGQTSVDMISASKEYCKTNSIILSGSFILTGYSEGGYASVAAQKYIEDNNTDITIKKNIAGAGAYDIYAFSKTILNKANETISFMPVYLWVLSTYIDIYNISYDYAKIFKEPYYSAFKQIDFDFSFGLSRLASQSPETAKSIEEIAPDALFTDAFRTAVINDAPEVKIFTDAFKNNTIIDWKPKAPLVLLHGTADDFVYYLNSKNAFDKMIANGGNVNLKTIEGKNHSAAFKDYFLLLFYELTGFTAFAHR